MKRRIRRFKPVKQQCDFCKSTIDISYREVETLRRFISERGKIVGTARTGVCAKHQRRLASAIKHARHLALLPFIVRA